jgi:hypothetical protein
MPEQQLALLVIQTMPLQWLDHDAEVPSTTVTVLLGCRLETSADQQRQRRGVARRLHMRTQTK